MAQRFRCARVRSIRWPRSLSARHFVIKDELLDQLWPKMVVEEGALHVQVSALRKVLGADAITIMSGRGCQFTLPVMKGDGEAARASRLPTPSPMASSGGP